MRTRVNVNVNMNDMQAKLARERAEWARQAETRHQERMKVLREEMLASQRRYQETMAKAELRYQERMQAMEDELRRKREAERQAEGNISETYDLAGEMLHELRRLNPEWEIRRQEVLRVSITLLIGLATYLAHARNKPKDSAEKKRLA